MGIPVRHRIRMSIAKRTARIKGRALILLVFLSKSQEHSSVMVSEANLKYVYITYFTPVNHQSGKEGHLLILCFKILKSFLDFDIVFLSFSQKVLQKTNQVKYLHVHFM